VLCIRVSQENAYLQSEIQLCECAKAQADFLGITLNSRTSRKPRAEVADRPVRHIALDLLDFDSANPRFGADSGRITDQREVLNHIVRIFGIDDVISSIAVNGYFEAEPLVCRHMSNGRFTVAEGNRRLAACLVLASDPRAADQASLTARGAALRASSKRDAPSLLPCIVFEPDEDPRGLLAYLGVRHISASVNWDSAAKAAWIARAVEEHGFTLAEISAMTGDQNRTVAHLLEGYYFVKQMVESEKFVPALSMRKGRGSNRDFPFSWVYTLLFSKTVRQHLGLPEDPVPNPVPVQNLNRASLLLDSMFGVQGRRRPTIEDSREIVRLAEVLKHGQHEALLESQRPIAKIEFEIKPLQSRLSQGLQQCRDMLSELSAAVAAETPSREDAANALDASTQVTRLAQNLYVSLKELSEPAQTLLELPPEPRS
jgi:hypothetical protein